MRPPSKVKIGPHWVKIEFLSSVLVDEEVVFGSYTSTSSLIQIHSGRPSSMQADTLLHEILHAIHYIGLAISMSNDDLTIKEETLTTLTATCLCQVMKDNPKVISWILENLK